MKRLAPFVCARPPGRGVPVRLTDGEAILRHAGGREPRLTQGTPRPYRGNVTPFDPQIHHRRSIRLPGYDYRNPGGYLVTIVTYERIPLFADETLRRVTETFWERIPRDCPQVILDEYVVMPNHLHGILIFIDGADVGAEPAAGDPAAPGLVSQSLGAVVGSFKSQTARRINQVRRTAGAPVWQRNYYEHIIRSERELAAIRQYIRDNPINWAVDPENVA